MAGSSPYPNLVDRALRCLAERGEVDEAELCAHLFGARPGAGQGGAWSKLLAGVLASDTRFEARPGGRWALRGTPSVEGGLAELEFVALAVRTGGPKPWRHRVVGVAALRVRGLKRGPGAPEDRIVGRWSSAIRPERGRHLPSYLSDFGLGPDELETAPTLADVADDFLAFLGHLPLVGLDVGLAVAFLQFELRRLGRPSLTNPLIELASLADLVLPDLSPGSKPDLGRLARTLGLATPDERRLSSLAVTAAHAGRLLLARTQAQGLDDLSDLLDLVGERGAGPSAGLEATRPRLLLDVSLAKDLPDCPGVYLLKDRAGHVLYVGKATSLRRRVTSYLTTDLARSRNMSGLVEATSAVETKPVQTELEAQLLEARLIAQLRPRFNVQRRAGVELAYLRRNQGASAPRAKGMPRRPPWASAATSPEGEVVGPLAQAEARRLLQEARSRFRLSAGRGSAAWTARADEAWRWVAGEADRAPVAGCLAGADLRLFALLAPWPSPPEHGPNPLASLPDGEAGEAPAPAAERVADPPVTPPMTPSVTPPSISSPTPSLGEEIPDEAGQDGSVEAPRAARIVVLGRVGWLGSLTLGSTLASPSAPLSREAGEGPGVRADDLAGQLGVLLAAAEPPGPAALAELGVALRWARREPATVVRLGGPARGARELLAALTRHA